MRIDVGRIRLSSEEQEAVAMAALTLEDAGGDAGSMILPRRAGGWWIERTGPGQFTFRRSSETEVASAVMASRRHRRRGSRGGGR